MTSFATKGWRLNLLVLAGIGCAIMAIVSFLLFGNPIGVIALGAITGILVAIFPTMHWLIPLLVIWITLYITLVILLIMLIGKVEL